MCGVAGRPIGALLGVWGHCLANRGDAWCVVVLVGQSGRFLVCGVAAGPIRVILGVWGRWLANGGASSIRCGVATRPMGVLLRLGVTIWPMGALLGVWGRWLANGSASSLGGLLVVQWDCFFNWGWGYRVGHGVIEWVMG